MIDTKSKISFSAYKRYMDCPKKEYYHAIERLRPSYTTSALVFGSAIDEALNYILSSVKEGAEPSVEAAVQIYTDRFSKVKSEFQYVLWQTGDFDIDLFNEQDRDMVLRMVQNCGYKGDDLTELAKELLTSIRYSGYKYLSDNQKRAINLMCDITGVMKASLLLAEYISYVVPRLDKIIEVQRQVEIDNIVGIIDFIGEMDGKRIIFDNKTSKNFYQSKDVKYSPQLALYSDLLGIESAGFIVLLKDIAKDKIKTCVKCGKDGTGQKHRTCDKLIDNERCHGEWDEEIRLRPMIQILTDSIDVKNSQMVRQSLNETLAAKKANLYPRNLSSCGWMYGRKCPYFYKCWHGSNKDLETKEKK